MGLRRAIVADWSNRVFRGCGPVAGDGTAEAPLQLQCSGAGWEEENQGLGRRREARDGLTSDTGSFNGFFRLEFIYTIK